MLLWPIFFYRFGHLAVSVSTHLLYFNFGANFIKWIMLQFANFQSCTINLGYISDWFIPTRGLQQGGPQSPVLFLLIIEPLGINIRENESIRGIKIGEKEFKSGQFADDRNLLLTAEELSLNEAVSTLKHFQSIAILV